MWHAYTQWLASNNLPDTNDNAWYYVGAMQSHVDTAQATAATAPLPDTGQYPDFYAAQQQQDTYAALQQDAYAAQQQAYAAQPQAYAPQQQDAYAAQQQYAQTPQYAAGPPAAAPEPKRKRFGVGAWLALVAIILLLAGGGTTAYAFASAEHWYKIDAEETSHMETVGTDEWTAENTDQAICYVGQAWSDCIDAMTNEWNFACAEKELTEVSQTLCDDYYDAITQMKQNEYDYGWNEVSKVGAWGKLESTELTEEVKVIDTPERGHNAVCYLGMFGECPK